MRVDDVLETAVAIGARLVGRMPIGYSRVDRATVVLDFGNERALVRQRRSADAAALEATVLELLFKNGAPVVRLLGHEQSFLVEREEVGEPLDVRLEHVVEAEGERWLQRALDALTQIHSAAAALDLAHHVFSVGASEGWIETLIDAPARLGAFLELPSPRLDRAGIRGALDVKGPSFIKWEATPDTAVARPDWSVGWRDFAQCGRRNRVDDFVALLANERVPEWPVAEDRLIARQLKYFDEGHYPGNAAAYLFLSGTLRIAIGLSAIIKRMLAQGEWSYDTGRGFLGGPPPAFARLSARAARWAEHSVLARPLGAWWRDVGSALAGGRTHK